MVIIGNDRGSCRFCKWPAAARNRTSSLHNAMSSGDARLRKATSGLPGASRKRVWPCDRHCHKAWRAGVFIAKGASICSLLNVAFWGQFCPCLPDTQKYFGICVGNIFMKTTCLKGIQFSLSFVLALILPLHPTQHGVPAHPKIIQELYKSKYPNILTTSTHKS